MVIILSEFIFQGFHPTNYTVFFHQDFHIIPIFSKKKTKTKKQKYVKRSKRVGQKNTIENFE